MADEGSIFAKAGFDVPKANATAVKTESAVSPSIFESAGFKLPGATAEAPAAPAWQDAEALENLASQGFTAVPSEPKKPGRGIVQALKDYPSHLLKGLVDTVQSPGNVLASNKPSTTESLMPAASGLAGLAVGGAFPKVGALTVAEKLAPSTQAVNKLVEAIGAENVPAAVNMLRENPRLSLADVSDPVRIRTQGLMAGGTDEVQHHIASAVRERQASRVEAANTAYTEAMGPAPNVVTMVEGLKDRARKAGSEAIQPALENAKAVDVTPVIKAIDERINPGITARAEEAKLPLSPLEDELVRLKWKMAVAENDPKKLHAIQSDIGDQAFQLSKSPDPKDRRLGSQLREVNEKLISQIDEAAGPVPLAGGHVRIGLEGGKKYVDVPEGRAGLEKLNDPDFLAKNAQSADVGAYRSARAKFKDAKDIHEAFDSGFDTLKNRSGVTGALEDSPQAFKKWMDQASPEEVVARRLGTRADIDRKINGVKNGALAGESVTAIPYNKEKLKMLFGDKEASRLIRVMEDSRKEAQTNAAIVAGSKTAETRKAAQDIEVRKIGGGNPLQSYGLPIIGEGLNYITNGSIVPGAGAALAGAAMLASRGMQKVGQMHDISTNLAIARNALATGPARDATIDALLSHPKVVRQLEKRANALATQ